MKKITIVADSEELAIQICASGVGFTPDAVREVDSGNDYTRAWVCFESESDAELWDKQQ